MRTIERGKYFEKKQATNITPVIDQPVLDRSVRDLATLTRQPQTVYAPIIALGGNQPQTSFTPTIQQQKVLQAMEAQKQSEKEQARKNNEWQKQQDSMQRKIQQMEAERQRTQEFKNRTAEQNLRNFINVQTQRELAGQFDNPQVPTNFNQFLAERGYDVTRPDTIPTNVFRPTKLDTEEQLRQAGVAQSIINQSVQTVDKSQLATTNPPLERKINYSGFTASPTPSQLRQAEHSTASSILFTPPHATNINEPIGRSTPLKPGITTTGLSEPRSTPLSVAMLAGAFIIT